MRLTLCPCCRRHIQSSGPRCPFCGALRAGSRMPSSELLLAFAAGAGMLAACGGSTEEGTSGAGTGGSGGTPDQDAHVDAKDDAAGGTAGMGGLYAPPPDAASEQPIAAYGPPPDASFAGSGGAYGPPPDAGDDDAEPDAYEDAPTEAAQGAYGPPPDAGSGGVYGPPPQ